MKTLLLIAAALLAPLIAHSEDAVPAPAALKIKVTNIENGSGTLYIAILDSAEGWLKSDADAKPFRDATQPVASTDDVLVSIADLPPGNYAISLFHDLNGNAELDTNFIGFPKEPFGFSAPMGKFGPPTFDEAAIALPGKDTSVEIMLN